MDIDNINILLIDDDQKIINSLKRILNKNEYTIYATTEAEKALKIMSKYKIDIIICDYNMPYLTGIEVLKQSKKILPNAIRMLITGESDIDVTISAINDVGIFYYISKPWVNKDVIDAVERAIKQKSNFEIDTYTAIQETISPLVFSVTKDEDIILIKSTEINYLYAEKGEVFVMTDKEKYNSSDILNKWENKLDKTHFFRCHRGYIVNIEKIERISPWLNGAYNIKLKNLNNESIPVSRGNMKKLRKIIEI